MPSLTPLPSWRGRVDHTRLRMNKPSLAIVLVVLASGLMLAQGRPRANVTPLVEADGVHAGSTVRLALQVALPDGLHVQSDKPRDAMLIPTVLTIEPPAGVKVAETLYPSPTDFAQDGQKDPLAVFEQHFVVGVKLTLDATVAAGELVVPARFRYQACDASTCFAPAREETRWTLNVVPVSTPIAARFPEVFDTLRFRR
jgi:DsbC/DsbD-like thiol-disulfide interchange protein